MTLSNPANLRLVDNGELMQDESPAFQASGQDLVVGYVRGNATVARGSSQAASLTITV